MTIGTTTRRALIRRGAGAAALAGLSTNGLAGRLGALSASAGGRQEPVSIEYWHINNESIGGPALKELIRAFNDANPDIVVTERFQAGDDAGLLENVQTAVAGNNPPDVAQISYSYLNYATANLPITPAEDLASAYGTEGFFETFPPNLRALGTVADRQVGTPYVLSTPMTYYNADLLKEAELDPDAPPKMWDEWTRVAETLTTALGQPAIVFRQTPGSNFFAQALVESNGGKLLGCEGGGSVAAFDSAEAAAAIQLWADLVAEGLALNVPTADQSEQAFLSQGVAVCIATTSVMGSFREQATFDLKAATFPAFGEKGLRLPSGGNSLFVLASDDGKREAAWRFVEHMESPENLSLFCLATGYLPARNGVALPQDALRDVAVGQREYVVPFVSFPGPNGFQAAQVLSDGVMQALGGRSRAEDVLVEAADEVDGLIDGQPCLS